MRTLPMRLDWILRESLTWCWCLTITHMPLLPRRRLMTQHLRIGAGSGHRFTSHLLLDAVPPPEEWGFTKTIGSRGTQLQELKKTTMNLVCPWKITLTKNLLVTKVVTLSESMERERRAVYFIPPASSIYQDTYSKMSKRGIPYYYPVFPYSCEFQYLLLSPL